MVLFIYLQIFSDSIRSNNFEYDKIINKIYFSGLKSYRISEDSLEKTKLNGIVKGYKFKVYKFENIVETFKSSTLDGKTIIEHSDPKDVEIYEFYEDKKFIFYIVKEVYLGINRRVYINMYK
ncbi:MAG: hypothetical protein N2504_02605 [candidate division WOR-3 bacterium]|nr:hypothetical protein [candidate division WOR-3 bacterium]MCX7947465.1 hypothetical protein [candidate division WOR-3 bacterium]MDW8150624.1 hypothetical protein [candidate division WOR-3 bacterium]